jgi:nucleotide-binding universal stress UspA family protein
MEPDMRLLIAYDGSDCAEAALDDLRRAGLPPQAETVVLTVAELWLPPPSSYELVESSFSDRPQPGLGEALALAQRAVARLQSSFPNWRISAESYSGSPSWEIIKKSDQWQPDLIIVGSHGRSALGRFLLGSVSQKVVTEARCSVRVARGRVPEEEGPVRILIGVDGSVNAEAAVCAVAARAWPQGSAARLLTSFDPKFYDAASAQKALAEARRTQQAAEEVLRGAGLKVSAEIKEGDPKRELVEGAEAWGADSIFVGATGHNLLARVLIGSVSAVVTARAHCSVEVVRAKK